MKTFFLAAIVGAATAHESLENPTELFADLPLTIEASSTINIGSVTGKSGWSKNGSGSDATLDMKLWMDWTKTATGSGTTYINTPAATHYVAIQNEDLSSFEGQKMSFSLNSDNETLMSMHYKTWDIAVPEDFNGVDFGSDRFVAVLLESGVRFSENITSPVDFWNIDNALCANIETNWWLGLTRSTPGVAEITTGATRKLTYQMNVVAGSKTYESARATVDATWAVDTSTADDNTDNTDDNTDNTDDNNTDDNNTDDNNTDDNQVDDTGDDNEADDGATGVTTFAGAVIAAVAALAF